MMRWLTNLWRDEQGALAFEWAVLATLLALGVVAGLAATRDAIVDELGDAAQAMLALDNSYTIDWPLEIAVDLDATDGMPGNVAGLTAESSFLDGNNLSDCSRTTLSGQPGDGGQDGDS